jgi:hypothetical protein
VDLAIKLMLLCTLGRKIIRVKNILLILLIFTCSCPAFAQREVLIKNLWARPQVHVLFEGYSVSFTIKDINKALSLLAGTGDTTYGTVCALDTSGNYYAELYSGTKQQYHNSLQPLLQNGVGVFLLSKGHGYIVDKKHNIISKMTMDIVPPLGEETVTYVTFYDPKTGARIFAGKMDMGMINMDLGIE